MDHIAPALIDSAPVPNVTPALVVRHDEDYVRLRRAVETRAAHHRVENHARKTLPTGGVSTRSAHAGHLRGRPRQCLGRGASVQYRYSTGKVPVKRHRGTGEPGRDTRAHTGTRITQTNFTTVPVPVLYRTYRQKDTGGTIVAGTHMRHGTVIEDGAGSGRGDRLEDTGEPGHTQGYERPRPDPVGARVRVCAVRSERTARGSVSTGERCPSPENHTT